MRHVAGEDHGAHVLELHQEDVMAGRVPRRIEHHDGAVPEYVLIEPYRLDLAAAADPVGEVRVISAGDLGCVGVDQHVPVALADRSVDFGSEATCPMWSP